MLTREDRAIIDFEREWWRQPGPKDQAIEFSLGLDAATYYDHLGRLARSPLALAYDPLTVKRVRSLMEISTEGGLAVS
ncbi:MAG: DUF3263 domain-containing protein [Acidimicrobiia bacterium]|nr:DUF3263 domain-containing protein [Acidimicrobiia bacterium]